MSNFKIANFAWIERRAINFEPRAHETSKLRFQSTVETEVNGLNDLKGEPNPFQCFINLRNVAERKAQCERESNYRQLSCAIKSFSMNIQMAISFKELLVMSERVA